MAEDNIETDHYVRELLVQWNLEQLCPLFQKHEVTFFALKHLKEEDFKELIPQIGTRTTFLYHWKDWKSGLHLIEDTQKQQQISAGEDNLLPDDTIIIDFPELLSRESSAGSSIEEQQHKDNSVQFILNRTHEGRAILKNGLAEGILRPPERKRLCHLILDSYLKDDPGKLIDRSNFLRWSHDIGTIFKKENPLVYYTAYLKTAGYREKRNAGGKLYECYMSRRRGLRKLGVIQSARSRCESRASTHTPEEAEGSGILSPTLLDSSILEERLNWLQSSAEPFGLVQDYWDVTFPLRKREISKPEVAVGVTLRKYPALSLHTGYTLLLRDFDTLYPDKANGLFSGIVLLREKILRRARDKTSAKQLRQPLQDLLSQLPDEHEPEYCGVASLVALLTLPFLVPLSTRKKSWRPSRTEVLDGFVHQVPAENHTTEAIRLRQQKLERLKETFQPWVLYAGNSLGEVTSAFVYVEGIYYKFHSLLEAIDVAFKIFHATGACYPTDAAPVWLVIQHLFYEIQTEFDNLGSGLQAFISDITLEKLPNRDQPCSNAVGVINPSIRE